MDLVLRTVYVFFLILVVTRAVGRRELSSMEPFDLILLVVIGDLVQPTRGRVNVLGSDSVRDEEEVRARVGLAGAEERSFYWRLTVEQNLVFFARLYGLDTQTMRRRAAHWHDDHPSLVESG